MQLGDVQGDAIYATSGLSVLRGTVEEGFGQVGDLAPTYRSRAPATHRLLARGDVKRLLEPLVGRYQSTNLWAVGDGTLLATVSRWVFRSGDGGESWAAVYELADTSPLKGVLRSGLCRSAGRLYLAEYSLGDEPARILASDDDGRTWTTFAELSGARHFHGLYVDPYSGRLWGNTGDRDAESAVGYFEDGTFRPVGAGDQTWRGVELAFTSRAILWGKDASFADSRPIYRLDRTELDAPSPRPVEVGTTDSVLFHLDTATFDGTEWVIGTTTSQPMVDSTAPPGRRRNTCPRTVRVVAASAASDFEIWHDLATFERRYTLADVLPRVPTADAHAFLVADADLGVLVNPYNTRTHSGHLVRIPPDAFRGRPATEQDPALDASVEVLA